jgi:CheY-like chemotaxis protein
MKKQPTQECATAAGATAAASELNNLLHIISGTADMLGNIWQGSPGADKYVAMLRTSVERAASVTAELVRAAAHPDGKIVIHPAALAACASPPARRPSPQARPRLLIVDDEPMALELAKEFLNAKGFDVATAENGCECLSIFATDPDTFALVVLDFAMPLMNGEETFDRLQAIKPDVRVALNTGFIDSTRAEAMLARGLLAVLPKPLRADEYVARIQSLLVTNAAVTAA